MIKHVLLLLILVVAGAQFAQGAPLMNKNLVKSVKQLTRRSSFTENWSRYPTPDALIAKLSDDFPVRYVSKLPDDCVKLTPSNMPLLGTTEPGTGQPSIDIPNSAFANWYASCLSSYIRAADAEYFYRSQKNQVTGATETVFVSDAELARDFGAGAFKTCSGNGLPLNGSCPWAKLSSEAKAELVTNLVSRLVGPEEVVIDLGLASTQQEFVQRVIDEIDAFNAVADRRFDSLGTSLTSFTQPGFLTVQGARLVGQLLISLQETLKY